MSLQRAATSATRPARWREVASLFLGLLILWTLPGQAQNLTLTLAAQPTSRGTVSSTRTDSLSLTVAAGETVSFARARGRDYRLQAGGGWFWTQVQEVPEDAETVVLTPRDLESGDIEIALDIRRKENDREQHYSSTLIAQPGEWVQLYGPALNSVRGTTVYGTEKRSRDSLYLRVEPGYP